MGARTYLDITILVNHSGHADGISRTLRHLVEFAIRNFRDIDFLYFGVSGPLLVNKMLVPRLAKETLKIDTAYFTDPARKPRFRERLSPRLKRLFLWVQRPRRQAILVVERLDLKGSRFRNIARRIKPKLLNDRYRRLLTGPSGSLVQLAPQDIAFAAMPALTRHDILILAGADWAATQRFLAGVDQLPRIAALCYDIIPLLFPQFFPERMVTSFRAYFHALIPRTELLIFSARQIQSDVEAFCLNNGIALQESGTVGLGSDPAHSRQTQDAVLPPPLARSGSFALFVSTIEPRKGHRLLLDCWKQLLAENIPQRHDFKLVFVGRKGWMVDDLIDDIASHPSFGASLFWLSDIDDATLFGLYERCAFTVYPSLYEGFGLPIVESFSHNKAVLASSAGALAETVAGFSPCLDPRDPAAWTDALRQWIVDPARYRALEERIKRDYRAKSWDSAAEDFFRLVDETLTPHALPQAGGGPSL